MIYLLCIFCPPVACLLAGRPGAALLNLPLCILVWLPGVIHAFFVVADAKANKRTDRLVAAMERQSELQVRATAAAARR